MNLAEFIEQIETDGQLCFKSADVPRESGEIVAAAILAIERLDSLCRLELAHEPPALNREQSLWAARLLYRAGQCLVFRSIPEESVRQDLAVSCPGVRDAAASYSVDLLFRRLPEFHARAARVSENDPLTESLAKLGGDWPLSSVGMKSGVGTVDPNLDDILSQRSLRQLYVDRVIATRDGMRCANESIRRDVHDALGSEADSQNWLPAVNPD
jgi:hypothetical protein